MGATRKRPGADPPGRVISLLTDFGLEDPFVGMMKGVILSINPRARIVDLCHGVRPQDVRQAAFLLKISVRHFPEGTIHVVVVDPGVGSERAGLAVRAGSSHLVGPDNGVLSWAVDAAGGEIDAVVLDRTDFHRTPVSATFHGRDVFAPVAAHLSLGLALEALGTRIERIVHLPPPRLEQSSDGAVGEIVDLDRFGNLMTSIPSSMLEGLDPAAVVVELGRLRVVGLKRTYADGQEGDWVAYVGSAGLVEIGRVGGAAADFLEDALGRTVRVRRRAPTEG